LYTYPEHLFRKILQFLCPAAEAPAKMKGQGQYSLCCYEPDGQKDKVVLSLDSYENYNIVKNVEKNKIIIDIPTP